MAASPDNQATHARRKLLTLGGCNVLEIGRRLSWVYELQHIWYATLPSIGSSPIEALKPCDPRMFGHLKGMPEREMGKTLLPQLLALQPDVVVLSLQTSHYDFAICGDTCVPNFTHPFFLPDSYLGGAPRPEIAEFLGPDTRIMTWDDEAFVPLFKAAFDRTYPRLFEPWVRKGARIFVYDHILAEKEMLPGGAVHAHTQERVEERNAVMRQMVDHTLRYPGFERLVTEESLNFTSLDSPWGRAIFHPIESQYVDLAARLSQMLGDDLTVHLWRRHALEVERKGLEARARIEELEQSLREAEGLKSHQAGRIADLTHDATQARKELQATRQTVSWRLTRPLRAIRGLGRRKPRPKSA